MVWGTIVCYLKIGRYLSYCFHFVHDHGTFVSWTFGWRDHLSLREVLYLPDKQGRVFKRRVPGYFSLKFDLIEDLRCNRTCLFVWACCQRQFCKSGDTMHDHRQAPCQRCSLQELQLQAWMVGISFLYSAFTHVSDVFQAIWVCTRAITILQRRQSNSREEAYANNERGAL